MKTITVNKSMITNESDFARYINPAPCEVIFKTEKESYLFPADIAGDSLLFEAAIMQILEVDPTAFDIIPQIATYRQHPPLIASFSEMILPIISHFNVNLNPFLPQNYVKIDLSSPPDIESLINDKVTLSANVDANDSDDDDDCYELSDTLNIPEIVK